MDSGTSVGSLFYDFDIDDSSLGGKLDDADGKVNDAGSKIQSGLNKAAAGFAVVGAGLTLYAKSAMDYTTQLYSSSKALGTQIGVSTEEASRLTAAFAKMGVTTQQTSQMFGIFSKQISASTQDNAANQLAAQKLQLQIQQTQNSIAATTAEINKSGDATGALHLKLDQLNNTLATQKNQLTQSADAFAKLGISTVDASGNQKDFETLLFEVADKFQAMPNGIDKTTDAMQLFGRSGKDMIKVLNLGSQGIQDLETAADKLGLTLTPDTVAKIQKLVQSQKDLKQQTDALKIAVGTATAPAMTTFNKVINDMVQNFLNAPGPVHDTTVAILGFGGPILTAVGGLTAFIANAGQAATAIADFGSAVRDATAAQIGFDAVADANPYLLLALAITAVIAAIVYVVTHLQQVETWIKNIADDFGKLPFAIQLVIVAFAPFIGLPLLIINNWTAISNFFSGLWQGIQTGISAVISWVSANWPLLIGILTGPIGYAAALIVQNFQGILNFISGIPGAITGFFSNAGSWLYNAGRDIVQGLLNGIGSLASTIGNWFLNKVPGWIRTPFEKALGINSPSKVFAGYGGNIVQGLVNGIAGSQKMLDASISGLNAGVIAPTINAPTNSSGAGGGANSGTTNKYGDTVVNIGQVNNKQDEDWVIRRIDRNAQLVSMGGTPLGAQS